MTLSSFFLSNSIFIPTNTLISPELSQTLKQANHTLETIQRLTSSSLWRKLFTKPQCQPRILDSVEFIQVCQEQFGPYVLGLGLHLVNYFNKSFPEDLALEHLHNIVASACIEARKVIQELLLTQLEEMLFDQASILVLRDFPMNKFRSLLDDSEKNQEISGTFPITLNRGRILVLRWEKVFFILSHLNFVTKTAPMKRRLTEEEIFSTVRIVQTCLANPLILSRFTRQGILLGNQLLFLITAALCSQGFSPVSPSRGIHGASYEVSFDPVLQTTNTLFQERLSEGINELDLSLEEQKILLTNPHTICDAVLTLFSE